MNNTVKALRSVSDLNTDVSVTSVVKPLDSVFSSVGELLFSWVNSAGYGDQDHKDLDMALCKACCEALGLPWVRFDTDNFLHHTQYFPSDDFLKPFLAKHEFIRKGDAVFIALDEGNRVIGHLSVASDSHRNLTIIFAGVETLALELLDLMKENVNIDPVTESRTPYYEVVKAPARGMSIMGGGGDSLGMISGTIDTPRVAEPAYYPYLGGSVHELFAQFMASDESVLILSGPPGTGKTSAVSAAIDLLHILPIYAKKTDVIADRDFVDFVFKTSDKYMAQIAGAEARSRADMFEGSPLLDAELFDRKLAAFRVTVEGKKEEPRVPMVICEDADILIAPRTMGNTLMGNLLNETDGISSNTSRKVVFLTNVVDRKQIEPALMREGRCFAVIDFRLLTPEEAVVARETAGMPAFKELPTEPVSLAATLRKPRKNIKIVNGKVVVSEVVVDHVNAEAHVDERAPVDADNDQ
jgi:hypothetical protein